jgi:DNA invertase Pin-like site-specific DNA recombinase
VALAQRMHASGEPASTIATTFGMSRATVYRVLAEQDGYSRAAASIVNGRLSQFCRR